MTARSDPATAEKILAELPAETRAWASPAFLELAATLPADLESRVKAITGSLARCQTNTADYLERKYAEIEEEASGGND